MKKHAASCPVCGVGKLQDCQVFEPFEYKGQRKELPCHFAECDACGVEQAGPEHTLANKRVMLAWRKQIDDLLSGAQIRRQRNMWGITQAQASTIFGGGPIAFCKYEKDDIAQSEAMDSLLRVAAAVPEAFEWLVARSGLSELRPHTVFMPSPRFMSHIPHISGAVRQHELESSHELRLGAATAANDQVYVAGAALLGA